MPKREYQALIREALGGNQSAIGQLLDRHRPYLKMLTQRAIDGGVKARIDDSDVVQQTYLSALRDFEKFEGEDEPQFIAWLRKIHERNIKDTIRKHVGAEKRSILNEQPAGLAESFKGFIHSPKLSPSQRVMQAEEAVQLAEAMSNMPEDQREAVRLRHLEGRSLSELATHFERSETAVASLLKRGLANLRKQFKSEG